MNGSSWSTVASDERRRRAVEPVAASRARQLGREAPGSASTEVVPR